MNKGGRNLILGVSVGIWIILGLMNIYWSDLNQDEGWYLYAAKSIAHGFLPYYDFAFTQGPVFPFVYALGMPWIEDHGILAGRWITFILAGTTLIVVFRLALRASAQSYPSMSAVIACVLLALNVYQSQFTTTVKTYALAALLVSWALVFVYRASEDRSQWCAGIYGGLLLALACGTRLSIGIAIPVACGYLLLSAAGRRSRAWMSVGLGSAFGLAVVYGPFLLIATEGLKFGLLDYHAGRSSGDLLAAVTYKGGFISRFVGSYFVACATIAALILYRVVWKPSRSHRASDGKLGPGLLWWIATAISAVHILAPFPYDDYQVVVYPILCVAIGASLAQCVGVRSETNDSASACSNPGLRWALLVVFFCSIAASFSSPVNQNWFVGARDRIWWRLKEESPLRTLRAAADYIQNHTQQDEEIFTQDIYLAVAANRAVPHGMELGPFCYFPEMNLQQASRLHVLNRDLLHGLLLTAPAPVAAVSGYGLAIRCPEVEEIEPDERTKLQRSLKRKYELDHEIDEFGQARTLLKLYRRKNSS